jgi:hypothetical protein
MSDAAVRALLGIAAPVPLTLPAMARSLRVTFAPGTRVTPRLQAFGAKLRAAFQQLGVRECAFTEALTVNERLDAQVVPLLLGEPTLDLLALARLPVQSLHVNQVVAIFDQPCPLVAQHDAHARLTTLANIMATHLATLCIFVTDDTWVMCTMNGAVLTYANAAALTADVGRDLVPKLAARMVPPRAGDVTWRYQALDPAAPTCAAAIADFRACTTHWAHAGFMAPYTRPLDLHFRSELHQLLILSFLDHRTGVSYGFLARQLPCECAPAIPLAQAPAPVARRLRTDGPVCEHNGQDYILITFRACEYAVPVPEIAVLCTRSGCDKAHLMPDTDLVLMTLARGRITIATPRSVAQPEEFRPSYDALTILASALSNCFVASLLRAMPRAAPFAATLAQTGLALSHWHAALPAARVPPGYFVHGGHNPAVPCATQQGAIHALQGKFAALRASIAAGSVYRGDAQLEPQHGTILCGMLSLEQSARCICAGVRNGRVVHPIRRARRGR